MIADQKMEMEMKRFEQKTLRTETKFKGSILNVQLLDIQLPDGTVETRELVEHAPAVAALIKRQDGIFVFVKQFRTAANRPMCEIVAGGVKSDENPMESVIRETREETGYSVRHIEYLTTIVPIPGYCTEYMDIYYVEVPVENDAQKLDKGEFVDIAYFTEKEIDTAIKENRIKDAKTIVAWYFYRQKLDMIDEPTAGQKLDFIRDMHKRLLELRNIEINLIWYRAVFMGSFMILLFTGYGYMVTEYLLSDKVMPHPLRLKTVALMVNSIGFIVSYVWILTFRGSKSWFENYQGALKAFVRTYCTDNYLGHKMAEDWNKLCKELANRDYENSNFFHGGGIFSCSKILILLGWMMLSIWTIMIFFFSDCFTDFQMVHKSIACSCFRIDRWCILIGLVVICALIHLLVHGSRWGAVDGFHTGEDDKHNQG